MEVAIRTQVTPCCTDSPGAIRTQNGLNSIKAPIHLLKFQKLF